MSFANKAIEGAMEPSQKYGELSKAPMNKETPVTFSGPDNQVTFPSLAEWNSGNSHRRRWIAITVIVLGLAGLITTIVCVYMVHVHSPAVAPGQEKSTDFESTDVNECTSDPCQHGGTCFHGMDAFHCLCTDGWGGFDCGQDIDECADNPCQNGACFDGMNNYTCECHAGWQGKRCDQDTDECSSNPCANRSTCNDLVAGYKCECQAGWEGVHCQQEIDDCRSNPCRNGANCVDGAHGYVCECADGWHGVDCSRAILDCYDVMNSGNTISGSYAIHINGRLVEVLCNMTSSGGGWTVLMLRKDGSQDFSKYWSQYKIGFGVVSGEFWIGNENIHHLTSNGRTYILSVEGRRFDGIYYWAQYENVTIAAETDKYRIRFGQYTGNTARQLEYHNGMRFTTRDQDNDLRSYSNCANDYTGGWWYNQCYKIKLTGLYGPSHGDDGIRWSDTGSRMLKYVDMKIRPKTN